MGKRLENEAFSHILTRVKNEIFVIFCIFNCAFFTKIKREMPRCGVICSRMERDVSLKRRDMFAVANVKKET